MKTKILTALVFVFAFTVPLAARGTEEKAVSDKKEAAAGSEAKTAPVSKPAAPVNAEGIAAAFSKAGINPVKNKVPIADFTLPSLKEGESVSLSSLKGKMVFLNFWATWCPPCRAEMPSMERLYSELKSRDFEILAVNLQESRTTVAEFMAKNKLTFPVLLDASGKVGGIYGVRGIPTTFVVDREGFIVGSAVGGKEWDTAEVKEAFGKLLGDGK